MCKTCVEDKWLEYSNNQLPIEKKKEEILTYLNSEFEIEEDDIKDIPLIEEFIAQQFEQQFSNCVRCKKWGFFDKSCPSCKNKKCPSCNNKLQPEDGKYCGTCIKNIVKCGYCKKEKVNKETITFTNICICSACSKNGTVPPDEDENNWYPFDSLYRDTKGDNQYYKTQWVKEHGQSAKFVRKQFGSTSDQCVGFELELLAPKSRQLAAKKILKIKGVHVERDGSLKDENEQYETGIEIVSNFGSINRVLSIAKQLELEDTVPSNRCGLHVHLTRSDQRNTELDLIHCSKMIVFWSDPANGEFLKKFTRRWTDSAWFNQYSKITKNMTRQHLEKIGFSNDKLSNFLSPVNNGEKYHIVNLKPSHTIEVRGFAATTDILTLNACIELAHYSYMFARTSVSPINLTWNNFMDWLPEESSFINPFLKKVG